MISRNLTILGLVCAILISLGLFQVKYVVLDLEGSLQKINREIYTLQESIHILEAEYTHLSSHDRLATLNSKYLDLGPVKPWQYVSLKDIPNRPIDPQKQSGKSLDTLLQSLMDDPLDPKKKPSHNYVQEKK